LNNESVDAGEDLDGTFNILFFCLLIYLFSWRGFYPVWILLRIYCRDC